MKRLKKWIAIALGAMTLLCTCACAPQGETDGPVSDVGNGGYVAPITPDTIVHAGGAYKMDAGKTIGFLSSEIETTSDGAAVEGVTVQLTATVEPADAWNKEVDWSFAWAEDAPTEWSSKPAENYIKIEPLTDGSTTANVTLTDYYHSCAITITVTTRDGGFTSSCDATCVSEYYETKITVDGSIAGTDSFGRQYYELYSGNKLNFTFKHYNKFGYESGYHGTLHLFAQLTARFVANDLDEELSINAGYWSWTAALERNTLETHLGGYHDFAFYFYGDSEDVSARDYCVIHINSEEQTGYIDYKKAFDENFEYFDGSWWAQFKSFEPVYPSSSYCFGGIEFGFSYSESGFAPLKSSENSYVKLRTSVSAVSLSASKLNLK